MISAALITPGGDPVSLCILTILFMFLHEPAIIIGSSIERKKRFLSGKSGMRAFRDPNQKIQQRSKEPLCGHMEFFF